MKRYLDDFFCQKLAVGNYVVSADVGNFPKAREHKNFIDVGNDEFSIGSIVSGLASSGKNVFVYDICGYVLKNSYSGFAYRPKTSGRIVIFSWGSGFAYDGCLLGHYPIDDVHLAKLCGFEVCQPYGTGSFKISLESCENQDLYVRMFDLDKWEYKGTSDKTADLKFVAEGWLAHLIEDYFGHVAHVMPYIDGIKYGSKNMFYVTDQIQTNFNYRIIGPEHPLTVDSKSYESMGSFIKNCYVEPIKEILGFE